jgi:hypothetical protein
MHIHIPFKLTFITSSHPFSSIFATGTNAGPRFPNCSPCSPASRIARAFRAPTPRYLPVWSPRSARTSLHRQAPLSGALRLRSCPSAARQPRLWLPRPNCRAVAAPIPELPPVTIATLLSNVFIVLFLVRAGVGIPRHQSGPAIRQSTHLLQSSIAQNHGCELVARSRPARCWSR